MSISKGPYEVDSEVTEGAWGPTRVYSLVDADGKTIVDALNSEVAEIFTEDESRWDEQGRVDMNFIARACNCHADLIAACEEALSFVNPLDRFIGTESSTARVLKAALTKAKGDA